MQSKRKPSVLACPRCTLVNGFDNKYCSKCSYPLVPSAFDEIKEAENKKILAITYFDKALETDSNDIVAIIGKGLSLYGLGRYNEANTVII